MRKLQYKTDKDETIFVEELSARKIRVWTLGKRKVVRKVRCNSFIYCNELYNLEDFYAGIVN